MYIVSEVLVMVFLDSYLSFSAGICHSIIYYQVRVLQQSMAVSWLFHCRGCMQISYHVYPLKKYP